MKDHFSTQSNLYAQYRPSYPIELINHILSLRTYFENVWDCGTGNGQLAGNLAEHVGHIEATDISANQLAQAPKIANIHYSVQTAEQSNFAANSFDLITVAQAIHWFNFDAFYAEVNRVAKPNALLVVIGYNRFRMNSEIDKLITDFYTTTIGKYWDQERHHIDAHYASIPFPFEELATPIFEQQYTWTLEQVIGYLNTWSAVKKYTQQTGQNPVELLKPKLKKAFGSTLKQNLRIPIFIRVGKVKPNP